ncbi:MAG: 2-phospho-L-lactate guanylyltransferase [Acidobacteria bacterium]|nr:2-phospho-L-lactate guanylyltransferase [Acidobacteriota bacterium]MBI3423245.1 2-phospho-L-lactate guanylyltransferase [Acidobacteriota bacterium]
MRYILIPVKDLTRAKQRLAALLTQAERTQLAWAMLENTFAAAAQTRTIDRIAVVTLYPPAIELAEKYGMEVILEREQISESASVDFGARELRKRGAEAVLRLPIDLPLITAEDIETVLAHAAPAPSAIIVPSRDGTGTNAILRCPPTLFPSHFGANSLPKHLAEAEKAGAQCQVVELPRIALDIDEPADVLALLTAGHDSPVLQWLIEHGIRQRLAQAQERQSH